MERTQVMVRHRRNSRCQPRRVVFLWILCLFAMASLLALLVISPAAGMLLSQGEENSPADSPQGGNLRGAGCALPGSAGKVPHRL